MRFERYTEKQHLNGFHPIHLDEMDNVKLMNRVDTKFVLGRGLFNQILPELIEGYRSLEVSGTRMSAYNTLYFDTEKYKFYLDHHNGSGNRYKVRIRKYVESDLLFLEVKNKFKGRTNKKRIAIGSFEETLSLGSKTYVDGVIGEEYDLESKLWNTFDRITLVNKTEKERLTIDINLAFEMGNKSEKFNHLVVAELKQERINRQSLFFKVMKKNGIRRNGFSKYCVGAITVDPNLKYNNFKRHLRLIEKLK